jgi:hypothetical protein
MPRSMLGFADVEAEIVEAKAGFNRRSVRLTNRRVMRNGQNKRMRGRNNQHHHHRKNQNPLSRVYESNGPDVKIRGNPSHIAEKYVQLARDAQSSGDPVAAENYYQHAEHYNRLIAAAQEQFRQQNPQFNRPENDTRSDMRDDTFDDLDEDNASNQQSAQGGEAPYGTREPQPYLPRDAQPFPNQQPQGRQQQHEDGDVDRLPSFITGGQSQGASGQQPNQGQNGHEGQPDRFPLHRRRRRHRGPRPEFQGGQRGDDAAQQD